MKKPRMYLRKLSKYQEGITLIALVITIIVLLILAGVTIATLTGENGLLERAEEARNQTEEGALEEEVQLKMTEKETDKHFGEERELIEYLNEIQDATVEEMATGDGYYVKRGNATVTVYKDGEVIEGKVDIWDGTSSEVPEIKEFEWYIYNCNQLKFFADCVNNGGVLTEGQKTMVAEKGYAQDISITEETIVYLMADLDLGARQEEGTLTRGTAWTPIGKTSTSKFNGTLEGNNYSIRGVYINQTENCVGFFGYARNLKNVTIKNSYILGGNCVGGLVGNALTIENCHNKNTTVIQQEGNYYVIGGIVGQVQKSIKNCSNTGTVIGKGIHSTYGSRVGGIIGQQSSNYECIIENCTNSGEVIGSGKFVGGITGYVNSLSTINNCTNSGEVTGEGNNVGGIAGILFSDITNSYNIGKIEGVGQTGGIVGQIGAGCEANITNCYNEGEISARSAVGGILGWASPSETSGRIEYNYNKGTVLGDTEQVGGIVGINNTVAVVVTNCYNKGTVEGSTSVGAVIGEQLGGNSNLSNLYYLNTLSVKAVNGQDYEKQNIKGIENDLNTYEDFIGWINQS